MSNATEAERVGAQVVEHACRELGAPAAWVHAWSAEAEKLRLLASRGLTEPALAGLRSLGADAPYVEARAARLGAPQLLRPDVAEPGLGGSRAVLAGAGGAGLLAVPLRLAGRLVGVLTLRASAPSDLEPAAVEKSLALAELLAVGVATALALDLERSLRAQLDCVRQAALALAEAPDLAAALQTIVEQARRLVRARYAALGIVRDGDLEAPFSPWVQSGMTAAEAEAIGRTPRPVGLLGTVPRTGRPVRLRAVHLDPRHRGFPQGHPVMSSFLGVPIRARGRAVGNLYLAEKEGADEFDLEDERAAELLAEHAGAAVERFRDLERLEQERIAGARARRALAAQSSTASIFAEAPPVPVAAKGVLRAIGDALGWEWGALWLVVPGAEVLGCAEIWRSEQLAVPSFEAMTRQITFPPGVGMPGRVWSERRPMWIPDVVDDPRFLRLGLASREGLHAALFVPVTGGGRFVGVIELMSREPRPPDQELMQLLAASGAQLGLLIERRRIADDRERLLAELAAERSWLRAVVERSPVGMVLALGKDGERVVANLRAEELLGSRLSPGDGLAQVAARLRHPDGSALDAAEVPVTRALLRGEVVSGAELRCDGADGERAILASAAPIEDAAGARSGAAMVLEDISSLRELQRLRDEWTSMVAHDLRQPVSVIATAASLISRGGAPPKVRSLAERILAGSRRLDRMIADLMDASRIDARRLELVREATEAGPLLRSAVERFAAGDHPVRIDVGEGLPPVLVDPERIEQVLGNLLSNAVKYGKPGGAIDVTAERDGGAVRISVLNEGAELGGAELEGLFARFRRGGGAAKRVGGAGLGLYISRGLVEAHGGRIWAERAPGARTAFRFTVPLAGEGPPLEAAPA